VPADDRDEQSGAVRHCAPVTATSALVLGERTIAGIGGDLRPPLLHDAWHDLPQDGGRVVPAGERVGHRPDCHVHRRPGTDVGAYVAGTAVAVGDGDHPDVSTRARDALDLDGVLVGHALAVGGPAP
jgi:hypothetical protein